MESGVLARSRRVAHVEPLYEAIERRVNAAPVRPY